MHGFLGLNFNGKLLWKVKALMEALVEEVKPVVTKKHEFDSQDESLSNALFGTFKLTEFLCKD